MKYRAEIDGMRAVAVVPVVLFHADVPGFSGGYLGVDVFFVISGFLITSIVARQVREGRFSVTTFYERRARRLMPALFAMLAATMAFGVAVAPPRHLVELGESVLAVCLYVSNIVFWRRIDYFASDAELNPLLHTWSLSVEEQFYLLWPTTLLLAHRLRPTAMRWVVLLGMVLSFGLGEYLSHRSSDAAFYLLPTRAWELLAGGALALFPEVRERARDGAVGEALPALGLVLVGLPMLLYPVNMPLPGVWLLPTVVGTLLVLGWAGPGNRAGRLLAQGPIVHVGLLSYSLYLWHQPLLAYQRQLSVWRPDPLVTAGLIGLSVVLAQLSWRYVEAPFRTHGRFTPRQVFGATLAASALACAIGLGLRTSNGWLERFAPPVREAYALSMPHGGRPCQHSAWTPADHPLCRRGPAGVPARALLLGDSHGAAIGPALGELAERIGLPLEEGSFLACPPLVGDGIRAGRGTPRGCLAHNRRMLERAADPAIDTLVIMARWNRTLRGPVVDERCIEGRETGEKGPEMDAAIATSLRNWLALGKRVVVVQPTPEFGCRVPETLAKLRWWGGGTFEKPRQEVLERSERFRAIVAAIEHPNLVVVESLDALCDEARCFTERDGAILYDDDDHLGLHGARRLVALLEPHLTGGAPGR